MTTGQDDMSDREVAIKVLPEQFAADPTALARFERGVRQLLADKVSGNLAGI